MLQKNQNSNPRKSRKRRGQALVESALTLMVFLMTLIGALDFCQLLFTHQMLVERTRSGLRWGMIHAWDGSGDSIANMVLYNQSTAKTTTGFLGLTRANVQVTFSPGPVGDPNESRLRISIVNYQYRFFTPFLARSFTNNTAVVESAPFMYRN
jgi:hypothetical protein